MKNKVGFIVTATVLSNLHFIGVTGHVTGVIELRPSFSFDDVRKDISSNSICLGMLTNKETPELIDSWELHSCGNEVLVHSANVIQIPLDNAKTSTHVILVRQWTSRNYVTAWSPLPLMFPGNDVINRVTMTSHQEKKHQLSFSASIKCRLNYYGPRCAVACTPTSPRHMCDDVTGELRCSPKWSGEFCEENVFLDKASASSFIKLRRKRANSWFRFEELQPGNIERECEEERCSHEEAREAFEDDALTAAYWRRYTDPNQCTPDPCTASHTSRCEDLLGDYRCHCFNGYFGKNCENETDPCSSSPCHNEGICTKHTPTSYVCACAQGYRGPHCDINIDDCVVADCEPHGECIDGVNTYSCLCDNGYTGARCDIDINECAVNPCQNGGNCTEHVGFYICACTDDYEGTNCSTRISPCLALPCQNDGFCSVNPDFTFTCSCPSRFTGATCQYDVDSPCVSEPCANGGTCYVTNSNVADVLSAANYQNASQEFNCICPVGFGGATCERHISACEYEPCPGNATCVNLGRQFTCICPTGYTGDSCDVAGNDSEITERFRCETNPCFNEARCLFHDNTTICLCRDGYNGSHCEVMIDYCVSSPCIHGGECIPSPGGFFCNCSPGFHDTFCETDTDECAYDVCRNNGTCLNTVGSFECTCDPYHTGRFCEVDHDACASSPCHNGGLCLHRDGEIECNCVPGYGNTFCDDLIDPCGDITNPCLNEGVCSPMTTDPTQANCSCTEGFYGHSCDKVWDYCTLYGNETRYDEVSGMSIPVIVARMDCGDHGDCVSENRGYRCDCHRGYDGDYCDIENTPPVVNCTSDYCICPSALLTQHLNSSRPDKPLACRFDHYDVGVCHPSPCLSTSCQNNDISVCDWTSGCITSYKKSLGVSKGSECVIMKISLNRTKLLPDFTVALFCHKLRLLPSYQRYRDNVTVHCSLLNYDDVRSNVIVAWDSVRSTVESYLIGSDVFQQLEQELGKDEGERDYLADGREPFYDAIIDIEFQSHRGHVQRLSDDRPEATSPSHVVPLPRESPWLIIVPVALGILLILVITCFLVGRRRHKTRTPTHRPNHDVISTVDDASMERVIVSPSRAKWYKLPLGGASKKKTREDFVNPVFIERPVCHDLTLQTSPMNGNAYVTTPKQSPNLGHKTVEESTVDYKACDLANGLKEETPYEVIKPLNPQLEDYAFALDTTPKTPILQKSKKATKVTKPKGNISQDGFDEIWSKPLPTPSEDKTDDLTITGGQHTSDAAATSSDDLYNTPRSYFPAHDIFFPNKRTEIPEAGLYQVPRKANPVA